MNTSPVTLSREDWNRLHDGLDRIRSMADEWLWGLIEAASVFGLSRPADLMRQYVEHTEAEISALAEILTQADGEPEASTACR